MTRPRLITIPISHFCEKARWALQRAGVDYREERHVQIVHRLAARRAGGVTVPVLVTEHETVTQSAAIVAWADRRGTGGLYPAPGPALDEVHRWEADFDATLGPESRRWMYFNLLPRPDVAAAYNLTGVPAWEQRAWAPLYPVADRVIRRVLDITPATAAGAQLAVQETFAAVGARLADGRPYLCGDTFTAADLTFACLAAAVVVPPEYGVPLPALEELPDAMRAAVLDFRADPAGAFALRLFREERGARA